MVATLKRKKSKPTRTPKFVDEKYTGQSQNQSGCMQKT